MKKFFLPLAFLFSWALTSCSAEDDFIEGSPSWLEDGISSVYLDDKDNVFGKYMLSSDIFSYYMDFTVAKVHDLGSKQYVSISVAMGTPLAATLITPDKLPDTETIIFSDASTDIRQLGYYDLLTSCFTAGGKKIKNKKLAQQILSTPGREIYREQYGLFWQVKDRLYGFDDSALWLKPHFADSVKAMCEARFNEHGDRFFWGTISLYVFNWNNCLSDTDTDGRGTPFVLETYTINDDHTLTRYLESFIAAEDGTINPLPFNDVIYIMSSKFGLSDYDPYHRILPALALFYNN